MHSLQVPPLKKSPESLQMTLCILWGIWTRLSFPLGSEGLVQKCRLLPEHPLW